MISAQYLNASSSDLALRTARLVRWEPCGVQRDLFPAKLADLSLHHVSENGLGINQTCFTLTGFGVFGTKR